MQNQTEETFSENEGKSAVSAEETRKIVDELVNILTEKKGEDVTVHLRGGKLTVNYSDNGVLMTGNAVKVYEGEIEL